MIGDLKTDDNDLIKSVRAELFTNNNKIAFCINQSNTKAESEPRSSFLCSKLKPNKTFPFIS